MPLAVKYHKLIMICFELGPMADRDEIDIQRPQSLVQMFLVVGIESRGAFVEYSHSGHHVKTARERNSLLLAQTQYVSPVENLVEIGGSVE